MGVVKYTDSDTRIFDVDEIDQIVNEFVAPAFGSFGLDGGFAEAIEENHHEGEDEPAEARGVDHARHEVREKERAWLGPTLPHRLKSVQRKATRAKGLNPGIKKPHLRF